MCSPGACVALGTARNCHSDPRTDPINQHAEICIVDHEFAFKCTSLARSSVRYRMINTATNVAKSVQQYANTIICPIRLRFKRTWTSPPSPQATSINGASSSRRQIAASETSVRERFASFRSIESDVGRCTTRSAAAPSLAVGGGRADIGLIKMPAIARLSPTISSRIVL